MKPDLQKVYCSTKLQKNEQNMTPEQYISLYTAEHQKTAEYLRGLVKTVVPDVIEKYYPGWKLIGYRVPAGKKSRYLGYIFVAAERISLGFEQGKSITDPYGLLIATGTQVAEIRCKPGEKPDRKKVLHLIQLAKEKVMVP